LRLIVVTFVEETSSSRDLILLLRLLLSSFRSRSTAGSGTASSWGTTATTGTATRDSLQLFLACLKDIGQLLAGHFLNELLETGLVLSSKIDSHRGKDLLDIGGRWFGISSDNRQHV